MPDTNDEPGGSHRGTQPHTPPFRGPAGPMVTRPALRPMAAGMQGRLTVPPFMPPIERGGPRPGTVGQPRLLVPPYVAPSAAPYVRPYVAPVRSPIDVPAIRSAADDVAVVGVVTAEYTTADLAYELAPFLEDDGILSIDAYVQRVSAAVDADTSLADAAPSHGPYEERHALPFAAVDALPPYMSIATPAFEADGLPPDVTPAVIPEGMSDVSPVTAARAADEIERERQALVDAIVGAAVQAAADKAAQRDRDIDHGAMRLFAADPFEEPFMQHAHEDADPALPSPFDDDPHVISDVRSSGLNDISDSSYLVRAPTPAESWSPPSLAARRGTPRSVPTTTPPIGIPTACPPDSDASSLAGPAGPRSPTPRRMTPVVSSRMITPYLAPAIPYAPAVAPTPVRGTTPVALSMPTPRSVPAVPDVDGARTVAGALEMVAAQIRAGHIVIAGDVPPGTDQSTQAACLAVALAALLGVRR
jgi:hypothetical protein